MGRFHWVLAQATAALSVAFSALSCPLEVTPPEELRAALPADPRAKITLAAKNGGFPTFNLLCLAGPFPARSADHEAIVDAVLNQYRSVGLSDVSCKADSLDFTDMIHDIELGYTLRGTEYRALVAIVTSPYEHAIATFVQVASDPSASALYRKLRDSMRSTVGHVASLESSGWLHASVVIAALIILFGLIVLARRFSVWRG